VVALATVALGMELIGEGASAATVRQEATATYSCDGRTGDKAAVGPGDSKFAVGLLGGGKPLVLPLTFAIEAPNPVRKSDGPFPIKVSITVALPESTNNLAKGVGITQVTIKNAFFSMRYSGAATGVIEGTVPDSTISLASAAPVTQTISGTIQPQKDGRIEYTSGPANLQISIEKDLPGVGRIGTVTVDCSASEGLGGTTVAPPGTPNLESGGIFTVNAPSKALSTLDVRSKITPDGGNPIIESSLKVTKGAASGLGLLRDGKLYYVPAATPQDASNRAELEVCGASRPIEAEPQINELQTLSIPKFSSGKALNTHPITFAIQVNGKDSAPIQTSFYNGLLGDLKPTPPTPPGQNQDFEWWYGRLNGRFIAPSPATVQAALEGTEGVGFGNVRVTDKPYTAAEIAAGAKPDIDPTRYSIEFLGALGGKPIGALSISKWNTSFGSLDVTALLNQLNGPAPSAGVTGPTTTTLAPPETFDVLNAKFLSGQITFDRWGSEFSRRITFEATASLPAFITGVLPTVNEIFPGAPGNAKKSDSVARPFKPASETGPLCTTISVTFKTAGTPIAVAGISQSKACYTTKVVRSKVKVRGRTRYVSKRVRVAENCCPKVVSKRVRTKVNGKTRYVTKTTTTQVACSTIRKSRRR